MRMLAVAMLLAGCTMKPVPVQQQRVLFLCPYGGAKSVMAAEYFNKVAAERALPHRAVAAAAETPYDAVPPKVAAILMRDDIDVANFKPRAVTPADFDSAANVITIGCDLSKVDTRGAAIEQWDDVPMVSVDADAAAQAIRKHVEELADRLAR